LNKILPPTYFFISLVISALLHYTLPIKQIIDYPINLLGFLFFLIGGILNIWADQLLKKHNTTVKPNENPTSLIQTGVYKISRHPMYLGMAFLLIGAGFILGSVNSFVGTIFFVVSMEIRFIPLEEKLMQEQFGDEFDNYKKKVRRWL
jgi:protein-S-isoprenylcysteine O-methyltransferase Ste14